MSKERPSERPTFCQFAIHILDVRLLFMMMTKISQLDAPNGQQGFFCSGDELGDIRSFVFTTTDPLA